MAFFSRLGQPSAQMQANGGGNPYAAVGQRLGQAGGSSNPYAAASRNPYARSMPAQSLGQSYGSAIGGQQQAAPSPYGGAKPTNAGAGVGAGMGSMMAMSDKHSKEEIQRLSSTNDALMKALDDSSAKTEGNMPPTEYPRLPSHTRFEDDPEANKVAAQNVGIQHATPPQMPRPPQVTPPPVPAPPMPPPSPQAMQPNPQEQNFGRSANPAFNVNQGMPDMSALDEAYKRQSLGG